MNLSLPRRSMSNSTKVQCPHCQSQGIPRLWLYSPAFGQFRYAKTQHICAVCGKTMYVTGGEVRKGITLFALLCCTPFIYMILALQLGTNFAGNVAMLTFLAIKFAIWFLIAKWLYKVVKKIPVPKRGSSHSKTDPESVSVSNPPLFGGLPQQSTSLYNVTLKSKEPAISTNLSDNSALIESLEKLDELRQRGVLTDEEFQVGKNKLLH